MALCLLCVMAACAVSCLAPARAFAYVDPSVVTYAIQAIAGVAVAVSAIAGVALRRTRRWLFNLLGIDPDAKRTSDPRWTRFETEHPEAITAAPSDVPAIEPQASSATVEAAPERKQAQQTDEWKWLKRFAASLLICFMAAFTLLFVAPIETVAGSQADFIFTSLDFAPLFIAFAAAAAIGSALIVSLFRGRAFRCLLSLAFAIGLGFWMQAMFLNVGLPNANGVAIQWKDYDGIALASAAAWAAVIVIAICASLNRWRVARSVFMVAATALIVIQGVGVGTLLVQAGTDENVEATYVSTEDGLYGISDTDNVFLIVLDTYDTYYLQDALSEQPDLLDGYTGFTWYRNTVGSIIPTRYGLSFLVTDQHPLEDELWSDFKMDRFRRSTMLDDIHDQGYAIGLYSTDLLGCMPADERKHTAEIAMNVHEARSTVSIAKKNSLIALTTCALYRDLPWVLKPRFWYDTPTISSATINIPESADPAHTSYPRDDANLYEKLRELGLAFDDRGDTGAFRLIHLSGMHDPYTLDEHGKRVESSTATQQAIGSMRIVEYYLDMLKDLGVYDQSTIIITADHGQWDWNYWMTPDLVIPTTPYILAKPPQTAEEASKPLVISDAPVIHDDVPATIIEAVGGDVSKYSGKSLFSYTGDEDPNVTRYYLDNMSTPNQDIEIIEWAIEGNSLDFANWHKTGRVWDATQ